MQILKPNTMALIVKDIPWFSSIYSGENQIGNKGCEYLNQAEWARLETLDLSSDNISSDGVKQLCKSNWPSLEKIYLSTIWMFSS